MSAAAPASRSRLDGIRIAVTSTPFRFEGPMARCSFIAFKQRATAFVLAVGISFCATLWAQVASAASELATFLPKAQPSDFFPGADRFGPPQGDPPIVSVYRGDQLQGFIY